MGEKMAIRIGPARPPSWPVARRLLALGIWATAVQPALAQVPAEILAFTGENVAACREAGGTPNLSQLEFPGAGLTGEGYPPYLTEADLNDDGRPDYVTDLAGLECVNAWSYFCGSAGCPVTVWLSGPGGHSVARGGHAQAWELRGREVVLSLHGQLCDPPRVGAEGCEVALRFDQEPASGSAAQSSRAGTSAIAPGFLAPERSPRPLGRPGGDAAASPPTDAPRLPSLAGDSPVGWTHGRTADGGGWYAGVRDETTGARLDWLCAKGRQSFLALSPYAGDGQLVIDVDGRPQDFDISVENGVAYAPISFTEPIFLHLVSGRVVTIADGSGTPLGRFTMDDAPGAIGRAEGTCRV